MDYGFLLDVALILIFTKVFGLFTKRVEMPQVVGALLAGLVLGPMGLNVLQETEFLHQLSEIGVIILMFGAGLETDINELKSSGKSCLVIAAFGVVLPLIVGYFIASYFNTDPSAMLENIFIGVVLTATSVSITVETLKEMGKLSTRSGNAILGAALIDDIIGIVALTMVTSFSDSNVDIVVVMFKIVAFFALSLLIGFFLHKFIDKIMLSNNSHLQRYPVLAFAFCLLYAYIAEVVFGVANITGAFIAGLIIANTVQSYYVMRRVNIVGYMIFGPIFFASIGLQAVIPDMSGDIIAFTVLITLAAIFTKIIGCGIGAKLCGHPNQSALRVGVGMVSRGEVALIVATKGIALGILSTTFFTPIIIMVVVTTVITPIMLKIVYKDKDHKTVYEDNKMGEQLSVSKRIIPRTDK